MEIRSIEKDLNAEIIRLLNSFVVAGCTPGRNGKRKGVARNPYRRYEVTEYQKEALKFLQPPEDITVSEWADKYRVLDAKTSAMPGPWRTEHTPYLKGIMDEFNNYETEEIVYVKPTQVGGTECLQNMVGYIVQQDPAPTMIVYPTDTLAKSISENRLQPMFKAAPELRKRFDENSQLAGITV